MTTSWRLVASDVEFVRRGPGHGSSQIGRMQIGVFVYGGSLGTMGHEHEDEDEHEGENEG